MNESCEKIVYVLGAGFSAPLGLPLISDFLLKAKDCYYNHLSDENAADEAVISDLARAAGDTFVEAAIEAALKQAAKVESQAQNCASPSKVAEAAQAAAEKARVVAKECVAKAAAKNTPLTATKVDAQTKEAIDAARKAASQVRKAADAAKNELLDEVTKYANAASDYAAKAAEAARNAETIVDKAQRLEHTRAAFRSVFELVESASIAKNYFKSDLWNIEELLSIHEIQRKTSASDKSRRLSDIQEVIRETVVRFMPELRISRNIGAHWEWLFGRDPQWRGYGSFAASLHRLRLERNYSNGKADFDILDSGQRDVKYDVVTLNYDHVLETSLTALNKLASAKDPVGFSSPTSACCLYKLHGCVSRPETIVPPTWNKGGIAEHVWEKAAELLAEANQIRFIGYSLPLADLYIRCFLKSSVVRAKHLKKIDVICLDHNGRVRRRYDNFVNFRFYRFIDGDVQEYLDEIWSATRKDADIVSFNGLESAHERFMKRHNPQP